MLIEDGPFKGLKKNGYGAVLLDPAWHFAVRSVKGAGRSPDAHYSTMNLEDLKALPIKDLCAKNAVLFMWIIDTHLEMGLELIKAWGFKYKTVGFYWNKTNRDGSDFVGMGYWTRANPEQCWVLHDEDASQCLFATTGQPARQSKSVRRLISAPRREHSRKPDDTHERIQQLVAGPYVELFCRERRPGWDAWGNEMEKFPASPSSTYIDMILRLLEAETNAIL